MAAVKTPYDTLLRVRRIEEDKAKAALAVANAEKRAATDRLESSRAVHRTAMERSHDETDLGGFMRDALHGQRLAQSVMWASHEVETAEAARKDAITQVTGASRRTQGLERLVDRAEQERFRQMCAADQLAAEESSAGVRARNKLKGT